MKTITSAENPLFKSVNDLNTAKGRREQGLFLAEGPHLAQEALKAEASIRYAAVRDGEQERLSALLESCEKQGAEILLLSPKLFYRLADTETPQGILIVAEKKEDPLNALVHGVSSIAVVLERLQDPGNLGTILRTALAVGAGFAVLSQDCADAWSQKVVRASQGAVFHLPISVSENIPETVSELNAAGWSTACGHLSGSDFFSRPRQPRTALVIGNEASGVSAQTSAACSALYRLPMPGPAESLNAAVAAGIMLYDVLRERNSAGS